ncbi:MAG: glutaredoxin family protein [Solirubrobacterales bacterium]
MSAVVTVFMRPGCHLCDEAEALLRPLAAAAAADLELIDIERDDELHRRYLELIPVIEFDGREVARLDEFRDGRLDNLFA